MPKSFLIKFFRTKKGDLNIDPYYQAYGIQEYYYYYQYLKPIRYDKSGKDDIRKLASRG